MSPVGERAPGSEPRRDDDLPPTDRFSRSDGLSPGDASSPVDGLWVVRRVPHPDAPGLADLVDDVARLRSTDAYRV